MIPALAIIILALAWLALETDRLRVRLLVGPAGSENTCDCTWGEHGMVVCAYHDALLRSWSKSLSVATPAPVAVAVMAETPAAADIIELPAAPIPDIESPAPYAVGWLKVYAGMRYKRNRNGGGRMVTLYDEVKQYRSTGVRVDRWCPICQGGNGRNHRTTDGVSEYTETVGNSTVTFTVCDDCLPKLRAEFERAQGAKPSKPRPGLTALAPPVQQVRVGSHSIKRTRPFGPTSQTEYETVYAECIPGKTWLKAHADFQMPDASIEIRYAGEVVSTVEHGARIGTVKALVKAHS